MVVSKKQMEATSRFQKKAYDRIGFVLRRDVEPNLDFIRSHASTCGESINGFIKRAIAETIALDTELPLDFYKDEPLRIQASAQNDATKTLDRIGFKIRRDSEINADSIRTHVAKTNETLNGFLIRAAKETIERDNSGLSEEFIPPNRIEIPPPEPDECAMPTYEQLTLRIRRDSDFNGIAIYNHAEKMNETVSNFLYRAICETIKRDNS